MNINDLTECPECGESWDDGDIYEKLKSHPAYSEYTEKQLIEASGNYGWTPDNPTRFKRIIGIEIPEKYDGISEWMCPDCKARWDRWTNELIESK